MKQAGRRTIRLKGYDYAQSGEYFLTLCTFERECLFGLVVSGEMTLSEIGEIAKSEWLHTPAIRPNVTLDEFVIMPNHLHGIIVICDERKGGEVFVGANSSSPIRVSPSSQGKTPFRSPSSTIGAVVRGFKAATTKRVNELRMAPGRPLWHRNYYEHIIRGEKDLERIREYIAMNPARWESDDEFARNIGMDPIHAEK